MKIPQVGDTLKVVEVWTPDSECCDELLVQNQDGDEWSVMIRDWKYLHKLSDANKMVIKCRKIIEGE